MKILEVKTTFINPIQDKLQTLIDYLETIKKDLPVTLKSCNLGNLTEDTYINQFNIFIERGIEGLNTDEICDWIKTDFGYTEYVVEMISRIATIHHNKYKIPMIVFINEALNFISNNEECNKLAKTEFISLEEAYTALSPFFNKLFERSLLGSNEDDIEDHKSGSSELIEEFLGSLKEVLPKKKSNLKAVFSPGGAGEA